MSGRRAAIAGFVAALLIHFVASAAHADPRVYTSPTPAADWTVTIGGEARLEPIFQGSKRDLVLPYPILAVRRFGAPEPFRGPRDGVGIGLFGDNVFQVGPVGQLRMPRRQNLDGALQGLGNVPWAIELGVFAEYWMVPWLRTRVEVRQGFNGRPPDAYPTSSWTRSFLSAREWTFSGGPRVTLASTAATSPYFGIDAAQSAASGLPLFDAKGGVRSVGAGTQARYFWTPQFATHAFVEYERLNGDAASSPLVEQRGTPNQFTFGIGATHSFDIKSPW